jgi:lysophospholipase L1-like esterase
MKRLWRRVGLLSVLAVGIAGAEPVVLDECDSVSGWQVGKAPAAVEAVAEAAHGAGALRITLPGEVTRLLAKAYVPEAAPWDRSQGLSFWIKGDGSDQFGCLAVTGVYTFVVYFPLKDTAWRQVTVPWADFIPESQVDPIGTPGGMPPSGITGLRLGSRWTIGHNNQPLPAISFCVDRIMIEDRVSPAAPPSAPRPWREVLAQLKARQPVRIQCMGDSITAGTGLPDRDRQRYAVLTQDLLQRWLGYTEVTCASRAVGGARSVDARAWVPRDFVDAAPDLVTLWIGYNDKSNAYTRAFFKASVNDYLDRICRATGGRTAILLFATGPGCGPRFVMLDDYAEAIREISRERGLPLFDIHRLLQEIGRERLGEFFADMANPNEAGHRFIAEALCEYLVREAGIDTPKPPPP